MGGAIVRSAIATRLDGFTIDEAYHISAGVSYVRYADFRINPEHPPLVKLWVGSLISATGFHLTSIRPFADKADERDFAEQDVYLSNDFNSVQRRARIAMWMLNGVLLPQVHDVPRYVAQGDTNLDGRKRFRRVSTLLS